MRRGARQVIKGSSYLGDGLVEGRYAEIRGHYEREFDSTVSALKSRWGESAGNRTFIEEEGPSGDFVLRYAVWRRGADAIELELEHEEAGDPFEVVARRRSISEGGVRASRADFALDDHNAFLTLGALFAGHLGHSELNDEQELFGLLYAFGGAMATSEPVDTLLHEFGDVLPDLPAVLGVVDAQNAVAGVVELVDLLGGAAGDPDYSRRRARAERQLGPDWESRSFLAQYEVAIGYELRERTMEWARGNLDSLCAPIRTKWTRFWTSVGGLNDASRGSRA